MLPIRANGTTVTNWSVSFTRKPVAVSKFEHKLWLKITKAENCQKTFILSFLINFNSFWNHAYLKSQSMCMDSLLAATAALYVMMV